jgi:hypothetical protein
MAKSSVALQWPLVRAVADVSDWTLSSSVMWLTRLSCCDMSATWYADSHAIPCPMVEWKGLTVRWKRNWVHGWRRRVAPIAWLVVV